MPRAWDYGAAQCRSLILAANIKTSGVKIYTIQFVNVVGPPQSLRNELIVGPDAPY